MERKIRRGVRKREPYIGYLPRDQDTRPTFDFKITKELGAQYVLQWLPFATAIYISLKKCFVLVTRLQGHLRGVLTQPSQLVLR